MRRLTIWSRCWRLVHLSQHQLSFLANHERKIVCGFGTHLFKNYDDAWPISGMKMEQVSIYFIINMSPQYCGRREIKAWTIELMTSFAIEISTVMRY